MDPDLYIKQRLDYEISWYDKKSINSQKKFKLLRNMEIVLSAILTLCAGLITKFEILTYLVGALGVIISVIAGVLSLNKYHENWIEYRSVCETLRKEKYMYLTNSGIYSVENSFPVLVERVETIISHENVNWAKLNSVNKGKDDK